MDAPVPPTGTGTRAGAHGDASPAAPRNAVLLRLEQLASEELTGARALVDGARQPIDLLAACIGWDLDASDG